MMAVLNRIKFVQIEVKNINIRKRRDTVPMRPDLRWVLKVLKHRGPQFRGTRSDKYVHRRPVGCQCGPLQANHSTRVALALMRPWSQREMDPDLTQQKGQCPNKGH